MNGTEARAILELLEGNARLAAEKVGRMLGLDGSEVGAKIRELEERRIIIKYQTLVNWERFGDEKVSALIEVRVAPQRDVGFDAVAERIYRYPEVTGVRLMSGAYDLAVFVEGSSLKEVSLFVATKLSTLEDVLSTTTHFVLRSYKHEGVILDDGEADRRLVVAP